MSRFLYALVCATCLLTGGSVSNAHGQGERAVALENGWARKSPTDKSTVNVYLEITNRSTSADELVSIWTPVAETIVVEKPHWRGLKMSMERVHDLTFEPGQKIEFRPGHYQITLAHLSRPLPPGQAIPLELRFRNAGRMEYSVIVSNKLIVSRKVEPKATN